ncbi:TIR domain-containing protein [Caenimonas sedimenti]|uniref:TIR domain-containing protein n=1 Tax=Caenimonas sedimenti TaxID=2596921 RepID=A0A562ZX46_9BURK|nr:TIR domain-containing protein [Caenimonas sedimenti]TWO72966.1 TIR domain-containing protein [Caenimonas sedimenti]
MDPSYDAFISYSHTDSGTVARIQHHLEEFKFPADGPHSGRRLKVFRDHTDIRASALTQALRDALARSRYLIVCCSPAAAASTWVREEIQAFGERPGGRVILLLVDGSPADAITPLHGQTHRYADLRHGWRLGLLRADARLELARVVAQLVEEDLRAFVPFEKERLRRRRYAASALGAAVVAAFALLALGLQAERTERRLADAQAGLEAQNRKRAEETRRAISLQAQGQAAVTMLRSGDRASALAALDRVVRESRPDEHQGYRALHAELLREFMPLGEVLDKVTDQQILRWRGRNYLKLPGAQVRPLDSPVVSLHGRTSDGGTLLVMDVRRKVTLYRLPALEQFYSFTLENAAPLGLHQGPKGSLLLSYAELGLHSDEDSDDAQEVGDTRVVRIRPGAKPGHEVLPEKAAVASLPPRVDGAGPVTLQFPAARTEAELWKSAKPIVQVNRRDAEFMNPEAVARAGKLVYAGSAGKGRDAFDKLSSSDFPPVFFESEGQRFVRTLTIEGNQHGAQNICRLQGDQAVACEVIYLTARTSSKWSPGNRYFALMGHEVQQGAFRLIDLSGGLQPCTGYPDPAEQVADAAFSADSRRLAVLTQEDELWLYELNGPCGIKLARRISHPLFSAWRKADQAARTRSSGVSVAFAGDRAVVAAHRDGRAIAFSLEDGGVKWTFGSTGAGASRFVRIRSSADGSLVALHNDGELRAIDGEYGTLVTTFKRKLPDQKAGDGIEDVELPAGRDIVLHWRAGPTVQRFVFGGPDRSTSAADTAIELRTGIDARAGGQPIEDLEALARRR